jgi:hypothetical protein
MPVLAGVPWVKKKAIAAAEILDLLLEMQEVSGLIVADRALV